jgi:glycosyltransferase involved in cell wall biosynthesis
MRLALDARLCAIHAGGISRHIRQLLAGYATLGPAEEILVLVHRQSREGFAPFATRRLLTPPHHRLEGWTLPLELWPLRPDLLHCPDTVVPRAWRGASVVTVHDVAYLRRPELLTPASRRYYGGVSRAVQVATRVIAVSEHTRRELLALTSVPPERLRVVHNAVDRRYGEPGDPANDAAVVGRLALREPFILFVSTIEPRKNVTTLLEAYRQLRDSGRDLPLALVGADGWLSEPVHEAVRTLGLEAHARFLGHVPDDDLAALYRRAAVLAHPALDEGFGYPPLEAMAAGTLTVVSDAGSLPEIVGEAALRVPPTDAAAWAAALARVLDDRALAQDLAAAGRQRAAAFTIERMARATLDVCREAWAEHMMSKKRTHDRGS